MQGSRRSLARLTGLSAARVSTLIPCYTDLVANLTIAVDEDVLQRARVRAAEQGTSVNAVLREQLIRFADPAAGDRAADDFLALARERAGRSTGGRRAWVREELHLERFSVGQRAHDDRGESG
jgi:plasmid stability protein